MKLESQHQNQNSTKNTGGLGGLAGLGMKEKVTEGDFALKIF